MKQYREKNSDKLKEYEKNRKNKEERLEKAKEKITCQCGCLICKFVLSRHMKSKKHMNLISQKSISSMITDTFAGAVLETIVK
jgi:hypothetical protein